MKKITILFLLVIPINCFAQKFENYLDWVISHPINNDTILCLYDDAFDRIDFRLGTAMRQGWKEKYYVHLFEYKKTLVDSATVYSNRCNTENEISEEVYTAMETMKTNYWDKINQLEMEQLLLHATKGKLLDAENIEELYDKPTELVEEYIKLAKYKKVPDRHRWYYVYSSMDKKYIQIYFDSNKGKVNRISYDWGNKRTLNTNDVQTAFWLLKIKKDIANMMLGK